MDDDLSVGIIASSQPTAASTPSSTQAGHRSTVSYGTRAQFARWVNAAYPRTGC